MQEVIKYIIVEYINDFEMRNWLEGNMLVFYNRSNGKATHKEAFSFVIQSATSQFNLTREEHEKVVDCLWNKLIAKNHSLTHIW